MSNSLRDQLLGLGFKPAPEPQRPHKPAHKPHKRPAASSDGERAARPGAPRKAGTPRAGQGGKPRTREDIDLAKAYAIRAQKEKEERIAAEQARQEEARRRREARAKLAELVRDKALNDPNAEIARHFPYGGKIKRVYVTEAQLKALNAGELGVLQLDGRYLLVTAELLAQAEAIFAPAIALKVDPGAPAEEDPYSDPKYQVPDDLVW
ncbi:DUF2058 domain-containing protein [Vulcaniibacterium tengchongense]|uniref:Uncharacterized protein YaiL (DUF2058 family) n=1 Tax=Vulcaniibacterium tengchongense TaxID=1273429 RepID=A0A3N4VJE0_9GAMM|nr:DUF2058 family protein [Vulcaniibacterium tengchongense]RPE81535.1 uncharacterized protein YaiL (DUF2058 family) [Vulcaniibacterium tengchongense]